MDHRIDVLFSVLCLFTFGIGVPGNLISLKYFLTKRKDLPTCIYIIISSVDMLTCLCTLNVGISYLYYREPKLFGNIGSCQIWGIIWTIMPFMSVYLVSVLSMTRTFSLLFPLKVTNKRSIILLILLYMLYLTLRAVSPYWFSDVDIYTYNGTTVECKYYSHNLQWSYFATTTGLIQLAVPILPILISCCISVAMIVSSLKVSSSNVSSTNRKKKATITIIIVTLAYIIFNIPLCVGLFIYWIEKFSYSKVNRLGKSTYAYLYSLMYVISVALNASFNPIIYFLRFAKFRSSVLNSFNFRNNIDNVSISLREFNVQRHSLPGMTKHVQGAWSTLTPQLKRPQRVSSLQNLR